MRSRTLKPLLVLIGLCVGCWLLFIGLLAAAWWAITSCLEMITS